MSLFDCCRFSKFPAKIRTFSDMHKQKSLLYEKMQNFSLLFARFKKNAYLCAVFLPCLAHIGFRFTSLRLKALADSTNRQHFLFNS